MYISSNWSPIPASSAVKFCFQATLPCGVVAVVELVQGVAGAVIRPRLLDDPAELVEARVGVASAR